MELHPVNQAHSYPLSSLLDLSDQPGRKAGALFERNLKEYRLLLEFLENTLTALKNRSLSLFDPTVGENACQIRAFKIALALTSGSLKVRPELEEEIVNVKFKINTLLHSNLGIKVSRTSDDLITPRQLFSSNQLEINLSEEEKFAYASYLLTISRDKEIPGQDVIPNFGLVEKDKMCVREVAKPNFFKQFSSDEISNKFTIALVKKLRLLLSESSVKFVQDEAKALNNKNLIRMTSDEFKLKHSHGWPCLPMFWTYMVLCQTAAEKGLPLKFQVTLLLEKEEISQTEKEHIILATDDKNAYQAVPKEKEALFSGKTAVCISGVAISSQSSPLSKQKWRDQISLHKLNIIYAGTAHHRQYPEAANETLMNSFEDRNSFTLFAEKTGFCITNPSLFFIQHVYPTIL